MIRRLLIVTVLMFLPFAARAQETGSAVGEVELSPATEKAITKGLKYLAKSQNANGSWGKIYPTAETSAALMAFMLQGHFPKRRPYGATLEKAVRYLIQRGIAHKGYLGGNRAGMYEHGLATLALSEVWGESEHRRQIRNVLKMAVDVILRAQNGEGGWRYSPKPSSADISVTVMQVVALASAKEAGILVPDHVLHKAMRYVKHCQNPATGGFAYMPGQTPGFARTAAGVMALLMTGQRNSRSARRGLDYLHKYPDSKFENVSHYFYAHYYAVQCMYQASDKDFKAWYPLISEALLAKQRADGSWLGRSGTSPAFGTSMAILIIGVPYRFLPIYQR